MASLVVRISFTEEPFQQSTMDLRLNQQIFVRDSGITIIIIQQIVTMPIYGKKALNICHPT